MDRSWKDGVAFCALVHRCRPDLVDMEKVKQSSPRENLSMAFELARVHLGIRPLLDVDDLMTEKPDKRSVVTYVSQFLRPPPGSSKYQSGVLPVKSRVLYQGLIEWIEETLANKNFSKSEQNEPIDLLEWRLKIRNEFLEKKVFYNDLKQNHHVLEGNEWKKVDEQWSKIAAKISEWNRSFDKKLPQPLLSIADWLTNGEKIIDERLELEKKTSSQRVKYLEQMIVKHNNYFKTFPIQRERFYTVAQTGMANGQKVDPDLIKSLRKRVEFLSQEVHMRMKTMLLLQIHHRIQCFVEELTRKMNLWETPPNLAALRRFHMDYKAEAKTKPDERADKLLRLMKETVSSEVVIPDFNVNEAVANNESALIEVVERFRSLGALLHQEKALWKEFEATCKELESELILCQTEKRSPRFDCRQKLRDAQELAEKITGLLKSTAAGLSLKQRLKGLEQRLDKLIETRQLEITMEVIETKTLVRRIKRELRKTETPSTEEAAQQDTMEADDQTIKTALDQLKNIKNVNETAAQRINALKARFETTTTTVETEFGLETDDSLMRQRIDELLQRKREIIDRKIDSETAARGAINEMQIINVTLAQLNVENDERNIALESDWSELYNNFNRVFVYLDRIKQFNANVNKYRKYRKILNVLDEVDGTIMALKEVKGCKELSKSAIALAESLKGRLHEKRVKEIKRLDQRICDVQRAREDEFEKAMMVIEIEAVSNALRSQFETVDSRLSSDRASIEDELRALFEQNDPNATPRDNFFIMEQDRVREKFRLICAKMEESRKILQARKDYLENCSELVHLLNDPPAGPSGSTENIQPLSNETRERVEQLAKEMPAQEQTARLRLTNIELDKTEAGQLFRARRSERSANPESRLSAEQRALEELEHRSHESPSLASRLQELGRLHEDKKQESDRLIDELVAQAINSLQNDLQTFNLQVDAQIERGDLISLRHFAETDGRSLHSRLMEILEALKGPGLEHLRNKWQPEQMALSKNLSILRNKLERHLMEKHARREKRYLDKLDAFGAWLDVIERELDETLNSEDLIAHEREAKLHEIQEICNDREVLAFKLETFPFDDLRQKEQALHYTERYHDLMGRLDELHLSQPRQIPVYIEAGRPGTSQSAFSSISSPTNISASEELDSDLQSVQSEAVRVESERFARYQPPDEPDYIQELTRRAVTSAGNFEVPVDDIRREVASTLRELHEIIEKHVQPPLETLDQCRNDASKLKYVIKKLSRQRKNILLLNEKLKSSPDKKRKQLGKIASEIRREKHSAKDAEDAARAADAAKAATVSEFGVLLVKVEEELREVDRALQSAPSAAAQQAELDRAADLLSTALRWAESQPLTPQQANQLINKTDQLRQATETLAAQTKQTKALEDQTAQIWRLLDLLNHTVDGSLSLFPLSLQPAIDERLTLEAHEETARQLLAGRGELERLDANAPLVAQIEKSLQKYNSLKEKLSTEIEEEKSRQQKHTTDTEKLLVELDRVTTLDQLDALEVPVKEELVVLQNHRGYVLPDLTVLHGMLNAIEAKRRQVLQTIAESEHQAKLYTLWMKRKERIEKKIEEITTTTVVIAPRYAGEQPKDFEVALEDVANLENALVKTEKAKENLHEAEEWLRKAGEDMKPEVLQDALGKLEDDRKKIEEEEKKIKEVKDELAKQVAEKTALVAEHNKVIEDINTLNEKAKAIRNDENLTPDARKKEYQKVMEEVGAKLQDIDRLKKEAELKESDLVQNPEGMNVEDLDGKVHKFYDALQTQLENYEEAEKAAKAREDASKLILQIHTTIKEVDELTKANAELSSIKEAQEKLAALQPTIVTMKELYAHLKPVEEQGEELKQIEVFSDTIDKKKAELEHRIDNYIKIRIQEIEEIKRQLDEFIEIGIKDPEDFKKLEKELADKTKESNELLGKLAELGFDLPLTNDLAKKIGEVEESKNELATASKRAEEEKNLLGQLEKLRANFEPLKKTLRQSQNAEIRPSEKVEDEINGLREVQLCIPPLFEAFKLLKESAVDLPSTSTLPAEISQAEEELNNIDRDYDIFIGDLMIAWQDELGIAQLTDEVKQKAELPPIETLDNAALQRLVDENIPAIRKEVNQLRTQSITVAPRRRLVRRGDGVASEPYDTILFKLDDFASKVLLRKQEDAAKEKQEKIEALIAKFREPLKVLDSGELRSAKQAEEDIKNLMDSQLSLTELSDALTSFKSEFHEVPQVQESLSQLEKQANQLIDDYERIIGTLMVELEGELQERRAGQDLLDKFNSAKENPAHLNVLAPELIKQAEELIKESDAIKADRKLIRRGSELAPESTVLTQLKDAQTAALLTDFSKQHDFLQSLLKKCNDTLQSNISSGAQSAKVAEEGVKGLVHIQSTLPEVSGVLDELDLMAEKLSDLEAPKNTVQLRKEDLESLKDQFEEAIGNIMVELEDELQLQEELNRINEELGNLNVDKLSKKDAKNVKNNVLAPIKKKLKDLKEQADKLAKSRRHVKVENGVPELAALLHRVKELEAACENAGKKDKALERAKSVDEVIEKMATKLNDILNDGPKESSECPKKLDGLSECLALGEEAQNKLKALEEQANKANVPDEYLKRQADLDNISLAINNTINELTKELEDDAKTRRQIEEFVKELQETPTPEKIEELRPQIEALKRKIDETPTSYVKQGNSDHIDALLQTLPKKSAHEQTDFEKEQVSGPDEIKKHEEVVGIEPQRTEVTAVGKDESDAAVVPTVPAPEVEGAVENKPVEQPVAPKGQEEQKPAVDQKKLKSAVKKQVNSLNDALRVVENRKKKANPTIDDLRNLLTKAKEIDGEAAELNLLASDLQDPKRQEDVQGLVNKADEQKAAVTDLLQDAYKQVNDELLGLTYNAAGLFSDPTATPGDYIKLKNDFESALNKANELSESPGKLPEEAEVHNALKESIKISNDNLGQFNEITDKLNKLAKQKEVVSSLLDKEARAIEDIENAGQKAPSSAEETASALKERNIGSLTKEMEKLREIVDSLPYMEAVESDIRFLEEAVEQVPADLEQTINSIINEVKDEDDLSERVNAELDNIQQIYVPSDDINKIEKLLSQDIPAYKDRLDQLQKAVDDAFTDRKFVEPSVIPVAHLQSLLEEKQSGLQKRLDRLKTKKAKGEVPAEEARKQIEDSAKEALKAAEAILKPFTQGQPKQDLEKVTEAYNSMIPKKKDLEEQRHGVSDAINGLKKSKDMKLKKKDKAIAHLQKLDEQLLQKENDLAELNEKLAEEIKNHNELKAKTKGMLSGIAELEVMLKGAKKDSDFNEKVKELNDQLLELQKDVGTFILTTDVDEIQQKLSQISEFSLPVEENIAPAETTSSTAPEPPANSLNEWTEKRKEIDEITIPINKDVAQIHEKWVPTKQLSLSEADNEVDALHHSRDRLAGLSGRLQQAYDWLTRAEDLPAEIRDRELQKLAEEQAKLDNEEKRVADLENKLNAELKRQKELADKHDQLLKRLNELSDAALKVHQDSDPADKKQQLENIDQSIAPLVEEIELVQQQFNEPGEKLIRPSDSVNVQQLKDRVEELKKTLDAEQKNAAKKLQAIKIGQEIEQLRAKLSDDLRSAEDTLADPNANVEQLKKAVEILDSAKPRINDLSKIYEDLEPEDEETSNLRAKTADQLAKLGELFEANRQSVDDRIDSALAKPHEDLNKLIAEAQNLLVNPESNPDNLNEITALLLSKIEEAEKVAKEVGDKAPVPEHVDKLGQIIDVAKETKKSTDDKWNQWLKFKKLRDEIFDGLDKPRQTCNDISGRNLRSPKSAEKDIKPLEKAQKALVPLRKQADKLDQLGQQLQPLAVAESEVRFVNADLQELEDDIRDQLNAIRDETTHENNLLERSKELINEFDRISEDLPKLDRNGVANVKEEAVPALKKQLDDLVQQHQAARNTRQVVERANLPDDSTPEQLVAKLNDLADKADKALAKLAHEEEQQRIQNEWLQRKSDIDQVLLDTNAEVTNLLGRYADENIEPQSVQSAQNDADGVSNFKDRLAGLRDRLQQAYDWLTRAEDLPAEIRDRELQKLAEEQAKLDNEEKRVADLENKLNAELKRQKELADKHDQLLKRLNELSDAALKVHQDSDPVDKKQQLENIDQSIAPLVEEIELVQQQFNEPGEKLIRPSDSVNVQQLKDRVEELKKTLDAEQKNAAKKLEDDKKKAFEEWNTKINRIKASIEELLRSISQSLETSDLKLRTIINGRDALHKAKELLAGLDSVTNIADPALSKIVQRAENLQFALSEEIEGKEAELRQLEENRVNTLNSGLALAITEGQQMLIDASAHPDAFNEQADKIRVLIREAEAFIEDCSPTEAHVAKLRSIITTAAEIRDLLDAKWIIWVEFGKLKSGIGALFDQARRPYDTRKSNGLSDVSEVDDEISILKTSKDNLEEIHEKIDELNTVALQFEHQDLPHSEVRFLEAEYEEIECDYDNLIQALQHEKNDEDRLLDQMTDIIDDLHEIHEKVERLSYTELRDLKTRVLPIVQDQIDEVHFNHQRALKSRQYVRSDIPVIGDATQELNDISQRVNERLEQLKREGKDKEEPPLNLEAASELLAMAFPDRRPRDVLRDYGLQHLDVSSDEHEHDPNDRAGPSIPKPKHKLSAQEMDDVDLALAPSPATSPEPEIDPAAQQVDVPDRQRNRWRRVLFAALPYQVMLGLLLAAACMIPDLTKEESCENLHKLFELHQQFINGPPPF
uniref:Calponin-homology (CH) domain-containing protein n=1 Tax=Bursaphelenchus xylophilus TaxID=6326 RepID=A0A1I7S8L5_BURXY